MQLRFLWHVNDEEVSLEKTDPRSKDRGEKVQSKAARNVIDEVEDMDGRTMFWRSDKKTKLIKSYKKQESFFFGGGFMNANVLMGQGAKT